MMALDKIDYSSPLFALTVVIVTVTASAHLSVMAVDKTAGPRDEHANLMRSSTLIRHRYCLITSSVYPVRTTLPPPIRDP